MSKTSMSKCGVCLGLVVIIGYVRLVCVIILVLIGNVGNVGHVCHILLFQFDLGLSCAWYYVDCVDYIGHVGFVDYVGCVGYLGYSISLRKKP